MLLSVVKLLYNSKKGEDQLIDSPATNRPEVLCQELRDQLRAQDGVSTQEVMADLDLYQRQGDSGCRKEVQRDYLTVLQDPVVTSENVMTENKQIKSAVISNLR